jgi:hypothetical protein
MGSRFSVDNFPKLIFMLLPNDHTFGYAFPMPTTESMIADNDEATGIFVEWLPKVRTGKDRLPSSLRTIPSRGRIT